VEVEVEAIGVKVEAVDEIAASTSLVITHVESEREGSIVIRWKSWLLMRNVCVIPNGMKRASSVWNAYQTHTRVRN